MAQDRIGGIIRAPVGVPHTRPSEPTASILNNPDLARWEATYEKLFNQRPDFSGVRIPEKPEGVGPVRLIVVAHELVEWAKNQPMEGVKEALKKHFLCWQYSDNLDAAIPTNDRDPRNGSYAIWVKDVREVGPELTNKSADDLKAENHIGITVLERELLEADYFFENGEHLDQQNITLCSGSRSCDGDVPYADWDDGMFSVDWYDPSLRDPCLLSRRIWA